MPNQASDREAIAQRGQALYEQQIQAQVEAEHSGEFLVLDVDTGAYEIDRNELDALRRARANKPDASLYLLRIGSPAAYRLGGRLRAAAP